MLKSILRSIFRGDPPSTQKGRSELVFYNLWLHIHPAKVRKEHLKLRHTGYLGFVSFFLLLILGATGLALMFYYHPYPPRAYQDMKDLQFVVFLGPFLRNMHRWAAQLLVVAVFLHLCRVFCAGAYKEPRQFNWVVGVLLLFLVLTLSFTGYLLPWDQKAFWAITVGTNIVASAPLVGPVVKVLLLGGHSLGTQALLRFYVLHVAVLPGLAAALVMVHLWRIRKDGGLAPSPSGPQEPSSPPRETPIPASPEKSYGLMGIVTGKPTFEVLVPEEEETVFSYPYAFLREGAAFLATSAAVMALALLYNAPLSEVADPSKTPNPAKAPWYFLGVQELVSHSPALSGILLPSLLVLALLLLPYYDRNPSRRPKDRVLALSLFALVVLSYFVLLLIGLYFRGAGWAWIWPWAKGAGGAA
ncbi:MAG: cytochrome b N-terminal domain-containing protein [Acidobacteriota bacterium]